MLGEEAELVAVEGLADLEEIGDGAEDLVGGGDGGREEDGEDRASDDPGHGGGAEGAGKEVRGGTEEVDADGVVIVVVEVLLLGEEVTASLPAALRW